MNQLYRSRDHKIISGVCSGLAEYFDLDPTIIRIAWVFSSIISLFIGIITYFVCVLIIPIKPKDTLEFNYKKSKKALTFKFKNSLKFAYGLIIIGVLLLIDKFVSVSLIISKYLFPIALIAIGFSFLLKDRDSYEK